jgi:DNA-binding PadR family transcriptional regulator
MPSAPESFLPLSTANLHILLALAAGDRHGYAIMQEVTESTEGVIKLGPGTLYRSLESLLECNLIEESATGPAKGEDQRRKYYRLTALGRRVLGAESERLTRVVALVRARKVLQKPAL